MAILFSTIVPTVGRATLTRAVESVLSQDLERSRHEVIVVNDSGRPLPAAAWQRAPRVHVLDTDRQERSIARNAGVAVARGRFLHFLDDDDMLLPGALGALAHLHARNPSASWLYGAYQTTNNDGQVLQTIQPRLAGDSLLPFTCGEGIPLQASVVLASRVRAVGGFDPRLIGVEDRDLARRVAVDATLSVSPSVVARIRVGRTGSTTNWDAIGRLDRAGREKILMLPAMAERLREAATDPYWRGRLVRAYAGSIGFNCGRGQWATAAARIRSLATFFDGSVLTLQSRRGIRGLSPSEGR